MSTRLSSQQPVLDVKQQSNILTVDEVAFCDSLRCMYWLGMYEVSHTTPLLELCVSLPLRNKAKYLNYTSEQIKSKMIAATGKSLMKWQNHYCI